MLIVKPDTVIGTEEPVALCEVPPSLDVQVIVAEVTRLLTTLYPIFTPPPPFSDWNETAGDRGAPMMRYGDEY